MKFDWAPDPLIAIKLISMHMHMACLELNGLHFEVYNPLNYMSYIKMPFEEKEADLDNALLSSRQCNVVAVTLVIKYINRLIRFDLLFFTCKDR